MKNTALYYVQTNGTDCVNRRRFSLEELEYQNQGCPEGWQWILDNVQTDARRSFAAVPHVAPRPLAYIALRKEAAKALRESRRVRFDKSVAANVWGACVARYIRLKGEAADLLTFAKTINPARFDPASVRHSESHFPGNPCKPGCTGYREPKFTGGDVRLDSREFAY